MVSEDEKDPFAVALGERLDEAWKIGHLGSRANMGREAGLKDINQLHRWARGEAVPSLRALVDIALVAGVSLDWLATGREPNPTVFADWLETPTGAATTPRERAFLRSLPLHGYQPSLAFYDLALQAFKLGLEPERASALARTTDQHR